MKRIYFALLLMILVSFAGCNEDFLDRNPLDQISSATFWKTQQDADMALTACYAALDRRHPHPWGEDEWLYEWGCGQMSWMTPVWDCLTDNASDNWEDGFGFREAGKGIIEANLWDPFVTHEAFYIRYVNIATCNIFFDNIDNVDMDEDEIDVYKAQAMFLRAYCYFSLSELYGGVPLVLHAPTPEEAKMAKSPKSEIVAQVIKDLDFAISKLPDESYSGKAVKGSALALKARVQLYSGNWAEAASLCQQVMNSGFSLSSSFTSNFIAWEQDDNPEIIFSIEYLGPNLFHFMDVHQGQWQNIAPLQNLVDEFECTDGLPIDESPGFDPENPYDDRDPRLRMTVAVYGDPDPLSENGIFDENDRPDDITTEFLYKKYLTPESGWDDYGVSEQDMVLMRYADVLLMYAEAQNEASGPDGTVYAAVNEVRARVDMPELPAGLSQSEMRDRIRHERRVELAFGGTRYFDLKRWGILLEVCNQITDPTSDEPRNLQEHHYLWPFPQEERDINPNLVQNPGY